MMVLKTLTRGTLHGYAIAQLLRQLSEDILQVEEGSLYPALQRLELNGWIEGEWGLSANNRRARFYKLTPAGRKTLASETARYRQMTGAIAASWGWHDAPLAQAPPLLVAQRRARPSPAGGDGIPRRTDDPDLHGARYERIGRPRCRPAAIRQSHSPPGSVARHLDRPLAHRPDPGHRLCRSAPFANSRASPAVAILSAALGIGACSMIFGLGELCALAASSGRPALAPGRYLRAQSRQGQGGDQPHLSRFRGPPAGPFLPGNGSILPSSCRPPSPVMASRSVYWGIAWSPPTIFDVVRPAFVLRTRLRCRPGRYARSAPGGGVELPALALPFRRRSGDRRPGHRNEQPQGDRRQASSAQGFAVRRRCSSRISGCLSPCRKTLADAGHGQRSAARSRQPVAACGRTPARRRQRSRPRPPKSRSSASASGPPIPHPIATADFTSSAPASSTPAFARWSWSSSACCWPSPPWSSVPLRQRSEPAAGPRLGAAEGDCHPPGHRRRPGPRCPAVAR